jgi:hypothetical protein
MVLVKNHGKLKKHLAICLQKMIQEYRKEVVGNNTRTYVLKGMVWSQEKE